MQHYVETEYLTDSAEYLEVIFKDNRKLLYTKGTSATDISRGGDTDGEKCRKRFLRKFEMGAMYYGGNSNNNKNH